MRQRQYDYLFLDVKFQSTHSLRSATPLCVSALRQIIVSIHALLAECDAAIAHAQGAAEVSIHALLAECDEDVPRNGANQIVSIHALLAECDTGLTAANGGGTGFNPRTPCGVRPSNQPTNHKHIMFQSTHSLRSATDTREPWWRRKPVSIHALLAECDPHQ